MKINHLVLLLLRNHYLLFPRKTCTACKQTKAKQILCIFIDCILVIQISTKISNQTFQYGYTGCCWRVTGQLSYRHTYKHVALLYLPAYRSEKSHRVRLPSQRKPTSFPRHSASVAASPQFTFLSCAHCSYIHLLLGACAFPTLDHQQVCSLYIYLPGFNDSIGISESRVHGFDFRM